MRKDGLSAPDTSVAVLGDAEGQAPVATGPVSIDPVSIETVLQLQASARRQLELADGAVQLIHTRRADDTPKKPSLDDARDALNIVKLTPEAAPVRTRGRVSRLIGIVSALSVTTAAAAMVWVNTSVPAPASVSPASVTPVSVLPSMDVPALAAADVKAPDVTPAPRALARAEPVDDLGQVIYAAHLAGAPAHEHKCLARALYHEARGESYEGQVAVAQVIVNRVRMKGWPDSICGVVNQGIERGEKCQFSYACHSAAADPSGELWDNARNLATDVIVGRAWLREAVDATHYHTVNVAPVWRVGLTPIKTIGKHVFYREQDGHAKVAKAYQPHAAPAAVVVQAKRAAPVRQLGAGRETGPAEAKAAPVRSDDNWMSSVLQR
jgi:Cell Wall Hydrolase